VATTTVVPRALISRKRTHDLNRQIGIEVPGRLIGEEQLRIVDDRARDGDALLLASGQNRRRHVKAVVQTHPLESKVGAPFLLTSGDAGDVEDVRDVVERRLATDQLEVLKDDADRPPQLGNLSSGQGHEIAAVHDDLAPGGQLASEQQTEEGRLPCARRPRDEDELTTLDVEADVLQRGRALAVALRQMVDLDQSRPTSSC
jgi:hypothetical protein